jgi:hypothetical protein
MATLGLVGEVVGDTGWNLVFHRPLWLYHVLPIHDGYTSLFSLYLWGAVGFHLYLLHNTLRKWGITSIHKLALLFCLEALVLEVLVNLTYLAFFNDFVFYYLPGDLWHLTSLQAIPGYIFAGYVTVTMLRFASRRPLSAMIGSTLLAILLVMIK